MKQGEYIPSFDGLRGLAVILVLMIHESYGVIRGGWIGVDLFFVLSGYLITSLLLEEFRSTGRIDLRNFYARRVLRLGPALLAGVVLANVLWPRCTMEAGASRWWANLASLFYFANLASPQLLGPLFHLWSLSVEEHFYLFWPVLAGLFLFRLPARKLLLVLALLMGLSAGARAAAYAIGQPITFANGLLELDPYRFTLYRMGALLMGCLLAVILAREEPRAIRRSYQSVGLGMALILLLAVAIFLDESNQAWQRGGFVVTDLLCALLVGLAALSPHQVLLSQGILRWIGRQSYGIYVYHLPICLACESWRKKHDWMNLLVISVLRLAATLLVAALSYRYLERPVLRLKKWFGGPRIPLAKCA